MKNATIAIILNPKTGRFLEKLEKHWEKYDPWLENEKPWEGPYYAAMMEGWVKFEQEALLVEPPKPEPEIKPEPKPRPFTPSLTGELRRKLNF